MTFNKKNKSNCCNSDTHEVPAYYITTMKTNEGNDIPKVLVCLKCGHECNVRPAFN